MTQRLGLTASQRFSVSLAADCRGKVKRPARRLDASSVLIPNPQQRKHRTTLRSEQEAVVLVRRVCRPSDACAARHVAADEGKVAPARLLT